jgi:hypothetical protein
MISAIAIQLVAPSITAAPTYAQKVAKPLLRLQAEQ